MKKSTPLLIVLSIYLSLVLLIVIILFPFNYFNRYQHFLPVVLEDALIIISFIVSSLSLLFVIFDCMFHLGVIEKKSPLKRDFFPTVRVLFFIFSIASIGFFIPLDVRAFTLEFGAISPKDLNLWTVFKWFFTNTECWTNLIITVCIIYANITWFKR